MPRFAGQAPISPFRVPRTAIVRPLTKRTETRVGRVARATHTNPADDRRVLSPNQVAKRRRIVEGAKTLLLRDGLRACTTRGIAQETGFSSGQIHYYFAGVGEIVDAAMLEYLSEISARVLAVETVQPPGERLASLVDAHASLFREAPGLLLAWLEYLTERARAGELAPMIHVYDELLGIFTENVQQIGLSNPNQRAQMLLASSVGLLIVDALRPESSDALHAALVATFDDSAL